MGWSLGERGVFLKAMASLSIKVNLMLSRRRARVQPKQSSKTSKKPIKSYVHSRLRNKNKPRTTAYHTFNR